MVIVALNISILRKYIRSHCHLLPVSKETRASMYKGRLIHCLHCSEFVELTLNTHCVSLTIYTFVPHKIYYCASQYILSSKRSSSCKNQKKYGIKSYLKYAFDTILFYNKMLLSYPISCSYQSFIGKNSMTSQP